MDIFEILQNRRSIRKYLTKNVEKNKLNKILELASLSPSAMNLQPYAFIVISEKSIIKEISLACNQEWKAPIIIAVCAFPDRAWKRDDGEEYWKADAAVAMDNISLVAYALGLGTCWIAAFQEEKIKDILQIDPNVRVFALTPVGYPDEKKGPVIKRKSIEDLVHYEKW